MCNFLGKSKRISLWKEMSPVTTNWQAPSERMPRGGAIENEISVQSSRRLKRAQVIAVTVIVSGVVLLVVAITAPLVSIEGTRGIPEHEPQGTKKDMSTKTATAVTMSITSTASTTPILPPTTITDIYSWSEWGSWLPHNATCGYQRRMRKCRSLRTKNHGTSCSGPLTQTRKLTLCQDCKEWYQSGGSKTNGVYTIRPVGRGPPFQVYCDMTTDGGGWTVFQRRQDGSEDFFRNWTEYKTGFGNLSGEFWLGNDNIQRLTSANESSLRVDLEDWNTNRKYAKYGKFKVSSESLNYRLHVEGYSGSAADSLTRAHNRMAFSTKDRDHDRHAGNCAVDWKGAWWYNDCYDSNLNSGLYGKEYGDEAVTWYGFNSNFLPLKFTEMKLRAT